MKISTQTFNENSSILREIYFLGDSDTNAGLEMVGEASILSP
jgi:hypothetical protein